MNFGKKRKWVLTTFLIAIMLMATACGSSTPADKQSGSQKKKVVNIGIMNAPAGFNPLESADTSQLLMSSILFLPLVELSDKMEYVPLLADSLDTQDFRTYTLKLNPKAKWTDGKPITADDVIFTVNLITDPKVASTAASNFGILEGVDDNGKKAAGADSISGVQKIDDYTVTFKTKEPVEKNMFYSMVGLRLKTVPKHILKDVALDKLYQNPFMQKPGVTSGAFKLVDYQKGQYAYFAANKEFFRGTPKLDEIYFKIMHGANITAQLQSGEIDMNETLIGVVPFEDYGKVKAMPNLTVETGGVPLTIQRLVINTEKITDARVRKAISLAINRKLIVDDLLKGDGEAIEIPYWSGSPFRNKNIPQAEYNPEKAKQLLQEAGWDMNRVIEFDVPSGNKVREQVADILVEQLKAVGLKVQVQRYDFVTSISKAKKGEFDIYIVGTSFNPTVPDVSRVFQTGAGGNYSRYSNKELDDLLVAGKITVDPVKSKAIYDRVQEIIAQEAPMPCVYIQSDLGAVNKRVLVGKPTAYGPFINIQDWDIKN
jgi:peptide/nickel transport system substrate-binding protein